jgi:hypothetical protein
MKEDKQNLERGGGGSKKKNPPPPPFIYKLDFRIFFFELQTVQNGVDRLKRTIWLNTVNTDSFG